MKHLLSLEAASADEIEALLISAEELKFKRWANDLSDDDLKDQCWALMFSKSSTRTRVSFEVGIRELGGSVMFLSSNQSQLGRGEPIKDTARVMGRMVHGAVIRTFAQDDVEQFAEFSGIPTINALTDEEHPCQILADLLTMKEKLGGWEDRKVVFFGDGDCNVAKSWMWAAERMGFQLVVAAPEAFLPPQDYQQQFSAGGKVSFTSDAAAAAAHADVLYTDVWVSMGKEDESEDRLDVFKPYQINDAIVTAACSSALVMHCLPAYREKEITEKVLEAHADTIFQQAENRLHAQKAVLKAVVAG
ncbi:MAG: ornithine carbamoyltransferase [Verrucomicrobiales bacterium]|nr:ornithine carbamoyltransferase [Verrucomicrobiales bacterium]